MSPSSLDCVQGSLVNDSCVCNEAVATFPVNFAVLPNRTCTLPIKDFNDEYTSFAALFSTILALYLALYARYMWRVSSKLIALSGWIIASMVVAVFGIGLWITDTVLLLVNKERSTIESRYLFWVAHAFTLYAAELYYIQLKLSISKSFKMKMTGVQFTWRYVFTPLVGLFILVPFLALASTDIVSSQWNIPFAAFWGLVVTVMVLFMTVQFLRTLSNLIHITEQRDKLNKKKDAPSVKRTYMGNIIVLTVQVLTTVFYLTTLILGAIDYDHAETFFLVSTLMVYLILGLNFFMVVVLPRDSDKKS